MAIKLNLKLMFLMAIAFVSHVPDQAECRCGYPDLPYLARMFNQVGRAIDANDKWVYFEEKQSFKLQCQNGLIGVLSRPNTGNQQQKLRRLNRAINTATTSSGNRSWMSIESETYIQCNDNRWNNSDIFCLKNIDVVPAKIIDVAQNRGYVPDRIDLLAKADTSNHNDSKTNGCIRLDANNTYHGQTITFQMKFQPKTSKTMARIVLIIKHNKIVDDWNRKWMKTMENFLQAKNSSYDDENESNHQVNSSGHDDYDHGENSVEIEENKHFLDFVQWNEHDIRNQTKQIHWKDIMEQHDQPQTDKHVRTEFASIKMSVLADQQKPCYLNKDLALNVDKNVTDEFVVFDCPLNNVYDDLMRSLMVQIKFEDHGDHDPVQSQQQPINPTESIEFCGSRLFHVALDHCGQPSIPVYGTVAKIDRANGKTIAGYSCMDGYRIADMEMEMKLELLSNLNHSEASYQTNPLSASKFMERICDSNEDGGKAPQWWPKNFSNILCLPKDWCRNPPPLPDATKFLFEYFQLDHLNRAVAPQSRAFLRCIQVTHSVVPFTSYRCGAGGQWIRESHTGTENSNQTTTMIEPICDLNKYRGRFRGNRRYYYHHYYYQPQSSSNMNTLVWGQRLTDNKYLKYYGTAGIVILFLASFIILIHVRRMAKKMSTQMREQSYVSMDKNGGVAGSNDPFSSMMNDPRMMMHSDNQGLPPDYYRNEDDANLYETGMIYSSDLPPPATPISMPSTLTNAVGGGGGRNGTKDYSKTNLCVNFDSIKF